MFVACLAGRRGSVGILLYQHWLLHNMTSLLVVALLGLQLPTGFLNEGLSRLQDGAMLVEGCPL